MRARGLPYGLLLVFGLALTLAASALARAQSHDRKTAASHFKRGSALFEDARYNEALEAFKAGYEAFPLPGFLVNMGQCYRKLERMEEAADTWRKFLDGNPTDARLRSEVEEAYAEVKGEIARRAETEDRRKRDGEDQRRALLDSIARQQSATVETPSSRGGAAVARVSVPAAAVELHTDAPAPKKKNRWWVWTLVGVAVAGAAVTGVTVGVLETQAQSPRAGSLGLIDGRR